MSLRKKIGIVNQQTKKKERPLIIPQRITNPRQKRYSLEKKAALIYYMLNAENREGAVNISAYAEHEGISRQTLYKEKKKFEENNSARKAGRKQKEKVKKWSTLESVEKTRAERLILELAVDPVGLRKIAISLKEAFELRVSKGEIRKVIETYSIKAQQILDQLSLGKYVKHIAVDEVFSGSKPILTGVELNSFAVVICEKVEKRDSLTWRQALNKFPSLELVTSDQATGIVSAVAMDPSIKHQFDWFHVKRDIGKLLRHLESQAYKKIDTEYKAQKRWQKGKTDNKERLFTEYQFHQQQANKTIYVFDEIQKATAIIDDAMDIFDKQGNFRLPEKSLKKIFAATDRMKKVSNNRKIINLAKRICAPKLLLFLTLLKDKLLQLPLRWNKNARVMTRKQVLQIIAKHYFFSNISLPRVHYRQGESKKHLMQRRRSLLDKLSRERYQNLFDLRILQMSLANFQFIFSSVCQALSSTWRSSSLVESFNSQIRVAQQVKKSLNNHLLALSILRWNMTPFEGGKRKGKSPYQILGVPLKHKNWLDLLMSA